MKSILRAAALTILAWAFVSDSHASPPLFTGLGILDGSTGSTAERISADGSVAVGRSTMQAFRWTGSQGMSGLGDLAGGDYFSQAVGVSEDGAVVVGMSDGSAGREAFRWNSSSGMVGLGDLAGGSFDSYAYGVTADGSLVVGRGRSNLGFEAFYWTAGLGMTGLSDLAGGDFYSSAFNVTPDGSVIVGESASASGTQAFRWTSASGMVGLGDLAGGGFVSRALDVSADGSVIVGRGLSAVGNEAFRWTFGTGMVGLGCLPGHKISDAFGVSHDGEIIVGTSADFYNVDKKAFIWDSDNGMRSLSELLTNEYGLDVTGWTLREARGISADGMTISGIGTNPAGKTEAWVARLPEPSTAALVLLGCAVTIKRRRYRAVEHDLRLVPFAASSIPPDPQRNAQLI